MFHAARRIAVAVAGLLVVSGLGACSGAATSSPRTPPAPAAVVSVLPNAATIGAFSPVTVTVAVGNQVEWSFQDANPHTATADNSTFTSPATGLVKGQTYSFRFTKPGTYAYHCAIHPQMHGTVVVQ